MKLSKVQLPEAIQVGTLVKKTWLATHDGVEIWCSGGRVYIKNGPVTVWVPESAVVCAVDAVEEKRKPPAKEAAA